MFVQGSTTGPSGLNVYGCSSAARAGQVASYVSADGHITSAKVVDAGSMPAGPHMGPDRIVLETGAAAPAVGCNMRFVDVAADLPAAA